jgi:glycosyltransferase involved in cell wall biosynthesis
MRENRKILFLTQSFIRNKEDISSAYLFVLAKELKKLGYEILVLAPHEKGLKKHEVIDDVVIYRFRYMWERYQKIAYSGSMQEIVKKSIFNRLIFVFFLFFFFLKGLILIRRFDVGLIHAHWWVPSGLVGAMLSFFCQKPLIITSHGTDLRILKNSESSFFLGKEVFRKAGHITVVSNFLKDKLLSELKLSEEKVSVIPMPTNPEKIKILKNRGDNKNKIILSVARYIEQKRLNVLIQALSELKSKNVDFEALLIGDGPERENLIQLTEELNLTSRVKFLGLVSQQTLNEFYNVCNICVLVSVEEGFGLVLAEALLCKKPVIGANSGGIPDIIQDGMTGILVPPDDAPALADAIRRVLTDEELAHRLANQGYEFVQKNLIPENIAKKFADVYRRIR